MIQNSVSVDDISIEKSSEKEEKNNLKQDRDIYLASDRPYRTDNYDDSPGFGRDF